MAAYVVAAMLGLNFVSAGPLVSAVWPAAGVALAALWMWGSGCIPWIWAGSVAANLVAIQQTSTLTPVHVAMVAAIGCTNTLAPMLAWQLLRQAKANVVLTTFRDVGWLYTSAVLAAGIAAAGGALSTWAAGMLPPGEMWRAGAVWWLGDGLGYVLVTPALVHIWSGQMAWRANLAPLLLTLGATVLVVFLPVELPHYIDMSWLPLVPLLWLGTQAGAGAVAVGFIAVAAVLLSSHALAEGARTAYVGIAWWLWAWSAAAYSVGVVVARTQHAFADAESTRRRLTQVIASLPAAAVQIDGHGHVLLNPAAERLTGSHNVPGMTRLAWVQRTFVFPESALREMARSPSEATGEVKTDLDLIGAGGQIRRVRLVGALAGEGEVWILEDITERQAQEAELRAAKEEAEAGMRAKTEFLATMSHEIRTPLNGVIGVAEVLRGTKLTAEQRQWLDTLSVSAESLLSLLHDLLDFSRLEEGRWRVAMSPCDPCGPAHEVLRMLTPGAASRGIQLRMNVAPEMPELVQSDAACLRQILLNLVGNAVKFTEHGTVTIELAWESGALVLEVVDTGIGMGEATLAKVFEPFTQGERGANRKYGGTGLGLAISRRLADLLNGTLTARSEMGRGSRFTLRIPAEMARAPKREPQRPVVRPPEGLRVLVAEDNPVNRAVTKALLEDLGAVVGLASDGQAAVDLSAASAWDLVLMDCRMPNMDGYTAARVLRDRGYRQPIVAMTAGAFATDREAAFAAGMDEWLVKPVTLAALADALDRWGRRVHEPVVVVPEGPVEARA